MRSAGPRLFLTDRGRGEPVLLITGWTISSAVFDPVADCTCRTCVIAYDHRGAGRSAPWLGPGIDGDAAATPRACSTTAAWAARTWSGFGGLSGRARAAIRMPHRVKSLILVGAAWGPQLRDRPRTAAGCVGTVLSDTVLTAMPGPARHCSRPASHEHPDKVAAYMPSFARHRAPPWTTGWQALAVAASVAAARSVASRTDARAPRRPGRMTPVATREALADGIPGAELTVVPDVGHAVPLERPEQSAQVLVDWVRRHAGVEPPAPQRREAIVERVMALLARRHARNTRDATLGGCWSAMRDRNLDLDRAGGRLTTRGRPRCSSRLRIVVFCDSITALKVRCPRRAAAEHLEQQRAQASPLPVVDNGHCNLGDVRTFDVAHIARLATPSLVCSSTAIIASWLK